MNLTKPENRTRHLQKSISPNTALLLSQPEDIHYYSGFDCLVSSEREAFLVVTSTVVYLIHATFSPTTTVYPHITTQVGAFASQLPQHLKKIQDIHRFSTLHIDYEHLLYSEFLALSKNTEYTLEALNRDIILHQRAQKDASEIAKITKAVALTTQLLKWIPSQFSEGCTESELTQKLYQKMLELGADITPAFPFIVAFGPHTALPHHQPTTTVLQKETPILIDLGTRYQKYCSDMTRTFWFGDTPSQEFLQIEKSVKSAYSAAYKKAKEPNVLALEVDAAARDSISEAGYGDAFIHTTGHGLGLEIHESPSLSWKNTQPLSANMAITIEPGIYVPGKFGYRFENTLILEESE